MATVAKNNIVRSVAPNAVFESALNVISAASDINQGDLCFFDDTANVIKAVTAETDSATFLGVSRVTLVDGKPVSPYPGTSNAAAISFQDVPGPQYGVEAELILKTGDTFNPGDLVYCTAVDAQTVSSAGATAAIGVYLGKTVTATAGQTGIIRIGNRFRTTGLVL